jgi:hypothetical protein
LRVDPARDPEIEPVLEHRFDMAVRASLDGNGVRTGGTVAS